MIIIKEYTPGSPVDGVITAKRGDTFRPKPIIGWDGDGNPYDFTAHTFRLQVRKSEDGDLLLEVPDASFTITQNADGSAAGVNNKIEIEHTKVDMLFETGKWVYDLEMTDAAGTTDTIKADHFILTKDVSRDE